MCGAIFTLPVAGGATTTGTPGTGRGLSVGTYRSRVSGLPGAFGELPVVALAVFDALSGNAALNGEPVTVAPC